MGELYPRAAAPGAAGQALRHRPQHRRRGGRPPRAVARPAGAPVRSSRQLAGWNGLGFVVQAYQKRCPFVIDYRDRPGAAQRPPADGPAGQGRLLGHARSSARRSTAWPAIRSTRARSTPTSPTSPAPASCWRRRMRCTRSSPPTTRTRWRRSTSWPGPNVLRRHSTSSSACTAWASRCTSRSSARWRTASSAGPAASMRRSARTRRCWPTWCAGCWRTAPTPRSSTASPTSRSRIDELVADPVAQVEAHGRRGRPVGLPHPAHPAAARPVRR